MTGLEQAFYIIGIVFMSLMLLLMILTATAVLIIRSKINKIHDTIDRKIDLFTSMSGIAGGARALKQAKSVIEKVKK